MGFRRELEPLPARRKNFTALPDGCHPDYPRPLKVSILRGLSFSLARGLHPHSKMGSFGLGGMGRIFAT